MTLDFQPPALRPLMRLTIELGELVSVGRLPQGERRMAKITGGRFEGLLDGRPLLGTVESGGIDWQILHADGALEIDAQYLLREQGGASIRMFNQGLRHGPPDVLAALARGETVDPSQYFFRTMVRFEAVGALQALHRTLAIATAQRRGAAVHFDISSLQ